MTRRKIAVIAGIIILTGTTILASMIYFNYPKLNIAHHEKSSDSITALPQDHEDLLHDVKYLLYQASLYNLHEDPDNAIDIAVDGIKKNHTSNPTHDSEYYRIDADLYQELATSLGLKKDEVRQKQAQDISNKAREEQLHMEKLKREKGLRDVLQQDTSTRCVPTKNTQAATSPGSEEPKPRLSVNYSPAINKCIPA